MVRIHPICLMLLSAMASQAVGESWSTLQQKWFDALENSRSVVVGEAAMRRVIFPRAASSSSNPPPEPVS